jgi:hemin uptake protein HemP
VSPTDKPAPAVKFAAGQSATIPAVDSRDLFRGGRQVQILHAGQVYTLRQTKDNKLILTK